MTSTAAERAAAREWLAGHAQPTTEDLLAALQEVYGDGAALGAGAAAQTTGGPVLASLSSLLPDAPPDGVDWPAYWASWTPGNADAAALLNSGGLADLLDNADVTVQGITGTALDALGNALADGAASGESADAIAASLADIVADPARAYRIANTELNRAVSQASLDTYGQNDVGMWELVISPDACEECQDVADGGPYPVDDSDDQPPIHPSCRCSVSPVVAGSAADAADG